MKVLSAPDLTPEQLQILNDSKAGFRLIRGAAGSGKTTAAVLRLHQLCDSRKTRRARLGTSGDIRALVITFNRTLRGYVRELARSRISRESGLEVQVDTFASWALTRIGQPRVIPDQRREEMLDPLLRAAGFPSSESDLRYFRDEVAYVLGRFHPDRREDYLEAERTGRGRTPAVPRVRRERLLGDVIAPYDARKREIGRLDWEDVAVRAAAVGTPTYDIVVADECQDFCANQMRAIVASLRPDHATTFVMDRVQTLYPHAFPWREIEIEMRPEMVTTLRTNHRNTREIARFAETLVRDLPPDPDGVVPDPETCERSGRRPLLMRGRYSWQLSEMLSAVQPFLAEGHTVALLHPRGWFDFARDQLRQRGIAWCELTRQSEWPAGPEQVALSTIHSVKGLEFDHVLMPGLNSEVTPHGTEGGDGALEALRRLLAMGITRARKSVMVGAKSGSESALLGFLDPATYDRREE